MIAVELEYFEIVQFLVEHGADVNQKTIHQTLLLIFISITGNLSITYAYHNNKKSVNH